MAKLIKVGIIGCGGIANGKHMPALKAIDACEMVAFCDIIVEKAIAVNTVSYDNRKIDEMNILEATKACMRDAIMGLSVAPDIVLVDALKLDIPYKTMGIIKGDALSYSIASASIVAKVTRDKYMAEMSEKYPEYGFENNSGYGTAQHIAALKEIGATPIHRKTFIKNFV